MARIAGFHPAGPGSIPGMGVLIFLKLFPSIDFFLSQINLIYSSGQFLYLFLIFQLNYMNY